MIVTINQIEKEEFMTKLSIDRKGYSIGDFSVDNKNRILITGKLNRETFYLCPAEKNINNEDRKYEIYVNDSLVGYICGKVQKKTFKKIYFTYLDYCKEQFNVYYFDLENNEEKICVFKNNTQIAEIEKELIHKGRIIDFKIHALDLDSTKMSILLCAYIYSVLLHNNNVDKNNELTNKSNALKRKYDNKFLKNIVD